jgi:hypothetical protein
MQSDNLNPLNLPAGVRRILWLLLIVWVLGATSLGKFVFESVLFVIVLLTLVPVVGFFGLQWWVKSNLVQDACPVCHTEFSGLNGQSTQCPNCGEGVQVTAGKFKRMAEPGVIDVEVVDVTAVISEAEVEP